MVGMEMADGDQREILNPRIGLPKAKESAPTGVNKNLAPTVDPDKVTG
jgi:hypothetical protein